MDKEGVGPMAKKRHSPLGFLPPARETILPVQSNQLDLNQEINQLQVGS